MNSSARHFIRNPDLVTRSIAGETIIVPIKDNVGDLDSIYTLNEVGTAIWEYIDSLASFKQLVEKLTSEYEVGAVEAESDVVAFLDSLETAGLIRQLESEE
jgi:hypothetical protein